MPFQCGRYGWIDRSRASVSPLPLRAGVGQGDDERRHVEPHDSMSIDLPELFPFVSIDAHAFDAVHGSWSIRSRKDVEYHTVVSPRFWVPRLNHYVGRVARAARGDREKTEKGGSLILDALTSGYCFAAGPSQPQFELLLRSQSRPSLLASPRSHDLAHHTARARPMQQPSVWCGQGNGQEDPMNHSRLPRRAPNLPPLQAGLQVGVDTRERERALPASLLSL